MTLFSAGLLLLGLAAGGTILLKGHRRRQYQKTDYYQQTGNSYENTRQDKGRLGEFFTYQYLEELEGYKRYLFNCYLPRDNGETTEVDVILLHQSGIYVFESKNYSGWIFGNENHTYWTQSLPAGNGTRKVQFYNPIFQNKSHLKWLAEYLKKSPGLFYSYIVFSDRCTLQDIQLTSGRHHVLNRYDLLPAVREQAHAIGSRLTPQEIDDLYAELFPLTQRTRSEKKLHAQQVEARRERENELVRQHICPRCGGRLVVRTARRGAGAGHRFLGCDNYPDCRFTADLPD